MLFIVNKINKKGVKMHIKDDKIYLLNKGFNLKKTAIFLITFNIIILLFFIIMYFKKEIDISSITNKVLFTLYMLSLTIEITILITFIAKYKYFIKFNKTIITYLVIYSILNIIFLIGAILFYIGNIWITDYKNYIKKNKEA